MLMSSVMISVVHSVWVGHTHMLTSSVMISVVHTVWAVHIC